jgi:hypothetical protein
LPRGLDDNQSALLTIAKQSTSEAQVEKVHELAGRKSRSHAGRAGAADQGRDPTFLEFEKPRQEAYSGEDENSLAWLKAAWRRASELVVAWARAPSRVRDRFISEVLRGDSADLPAANTEKTLAASWTARRLTSKRDECAGMFNSDRLVS